MNEYTVTFPLWVPAECDNANETIIYCVGVVAGIAAFAASWLIRRNGITEGPLARAEKPLMLGGAAATLAFEFLEFVAL